MDTDVALMATVLLTAAITILTAAYRYYTGDFAVLLSVVAATIVFCYECSSFGTKWRVTLFNVSVAACSVIGSYTFVSFAAKNLRFVYTQYFRMPKDLIKRYGRDSWVAVTGSSDGIGLGFAVEFARLGFNICLISRTKEKLDAAEKEVLMANPNVKTRVVVTDFRHCATEAYWDELYTHFEDIDISVLVNNVGINHTEHFYDISKQFLLDAVQVNCTTQMLMSRLVVNSMLSRKQRSAIISLSSIAGQRPLLYLSPYSATKAFNDFFSRALALEFPDKIDVLSLRPGYVISNMSKLTEKTNFVLDKYECARGCIEKLGYVTETYGDPRHAVYARSYFSMPEFVITKRRKQRLEEKQNIIAGEVTKAI